MFLQVSEKQTDTGANDSLVQNGARLIYIKQFTANKFESEQQLAGMKQKLILTLWKAQFAQSLTGDSIYCRLNYNKESKNSKNLQSKKSLEWKQTYVFPLAKEQTSLRIDFISLKKGEEIHFAKDNVAETLSVAKAIFNVSVKSPTKGSLPAKLEIFDQEDNPIGKVFIQYQTLKTQVAYLVQKVIEYDYLLKLSNFKVTFLRALKNIPTLHLKFKYGEKNHRQDFALNEQKGLFFYNYPVKLNMNKQIDLTIGLQVKQFFGVEYQSANESMKSGSLTQRRSQFSSIGKKNNTLDLRTDTRITALLDLTFKQNTKTTKKISLTTPFKNQMLQIGSIQFKLEAVFKTAEEKLAFEQQKRGIVLKENPENSLQSKRKLVSNNLHKSNGLIILNTIMGKLDLSQINTSKVDGNDLSLVLKLGKQIQESSVLQVPGKQLIFLDTFSFRRTWEQTVKFVLQVHNQQGIRIPTFFSSVNLRQLFQMGRVQGKKIKIVNQQKRYCGQFVLDMQYRQEQRVATKQKSYIFQGKLTQQQLVQRTKDQKRGKITERMKQRQQQKKYKVQKSTSLSVKKQRDIFTMAQALDLKDLILPPLKSHRTKVEMANLKRYTTLSPVNGAQVQKFNSANLYNSNGKIKFSRSPRFQQSSEINRSGSSLLFIRESDFDSKNKRGAFIGYGDKHDFTKDLKDNPGIGKYSIPSLWDKYHG